MDYESTTAALGLGMFTTTVSATLVACFWCSTKVSDLASADWKAALFRTTVQPPIRERHQ